MVTKTVERKFCDFCKDESHKICDRCKKDICYDHKSDVTVTNDVDASKRVHYHPPTHVICPDCTKELEKWVTGIK
jgi:predicted amidophosphoribosyltransferase